VVAARSLVIALTHCSTWERRSDFNDTWTKGTDAGRCHEAVGRPLCGGCAATAPSAVRHIASRVITASAPHAAEADVSDGERSAIPNSDSTGCLRLGHNARSGCSAGSAQMVEHVSARKVGEAAQSVIILALKEEVADQVLLMAAVSEGPRHGRQH
jgi:hypothetical protein